MKSIINTFALTQILLLACASENGPPAPIGSAGQSDTGDETDDAGETMDPSMGTAVSDTASTTASTSASTTADPDTTGDPDTTASTTMTSTTVTTADPDSSSEGGSSSTGEMCEEEFGRYRCNGWWAGMYLSDFEADPQDQYQFGNIGGSSRHECLDFEIVIPFVGEQLNNPMVMEACEVECLAAAANVDWSGGDNTGAWQFADTVCVFAHNGHNGRVPPGTVGALGVHVVNNQPGVAFECDYQPLANEPAIEVATYLGPPDPGMCAMASCNEWDPAGETTWSYNVKSRVHTVTVARSFLNEIIGNFGNDVYGCDDARWKAHNAPGNTFHWKFVDVAAGDALYEIGIRTNDYNLRIKRTQVHATPWFNLYSTTSDSPMVLVPAYFALNGYSALTLEWRRPNASGSGYTTHTMFATIVN